MGTTGTRLLQGNCLETMKTLPDKSIQCCVTSPPYFNLRSYNGGSDEIGSEKTLDLYIYKLVGVFQEVRRLLRDDGVCWINLGDSFRNKQLLGVPWRVAFALQADGWILRSEIIWHKPNPMPESVTTRPTKAHEQLFLLTKSAKYFFDNEAIKTDTGANCRSVWKIGPEIHRGEHFATMPTKLAEPCILSGSSAYGACSKCGSPWARVVKVERSNYISRPDRQVATGGAITGGVGKNFPDTKRTTTGWQPTCQCNADVVPCVVLDPFSGSGTTGVAALTHGRKYIGCDLNPDYIALSRQRIESFQPKM